MIYLKKQKSEITMIANINNINLICFQFFSISLIYLRIGIELFYYNYILYFVKISIGITNNIVLLFLSNVIKYLLEGIHNKNTITNI